MKSKYPVRPNSRESASRPNTPMVSRPNTPALGMMSDSLDFFRHGFTGIGDEILQEVRKELTFTSSSLREEVNSALRSNTELFRHELKELANSLDRVAGPVAGQNDQIQDIAENLSRVTRQLEDVQKKGDVDDMVYRIMQRLDVSGVFDVKMVGLFQRLKEYQLESKATTSELQDNLEGIHALLQATKAAAQEVTQLPETFTKLLQEAKSSRGAINSKCNHIMVEIGRIQQHMQLDYAKASTGRTASVAEDHECDDDDEPHHDHHDDGIRRVRETWCQTDGATCEEAAQTDPAMFKERKKPKPAKKGSSAAGRSAAFDEEALKNQIRQRMSLPQYNVQDCYKDSGFIQAIARSSLFDNLTLAVVALNSVWIAIDIDLNTAATITSADVIYQVMDHLFCTYFFCEIVIRFCAFEYKRDAFVDRWFVFDSVLVTNMVAETWILPIVMAAMAEEASTDTFTDLTMLRMLRMVKLLRLTRISRFLRSVPELVIIVKAIGLAARSVVIFFLLWLIVIYVFAVVLRQITDGSAVGQKWFKTVPGAMNTLLLDGILADYSVIIRDLGDASPGYWIVILVFVLLASITIMYMLVGVLVEVVGVISSTEKEGLLVAHLSESMREKLTARGHNADSTLTKYEMQKFLLEQDVVLQLTSLDINVEAIMEMLEMTYDDLEKRGRQMTFAKLIDMLLNGREGNAATVKDKTDLLRVLKTQVKNSAQELEEKMEQQFVQVKEGLDELRDDTLN